MRSVRVRLAAVLGVLLLPAAVYAQSSMAGVVKDTSGAVLPGVTVEASSPALIEKVRSVVTDTAGQYKIVDLRPGTYTVTFTLTGFSVFKREGIELTGSGTVTINADMKVGALEETITVSGETPVVDVQNAARSEVLSGDLVAKTPAARSWNGIMLLMPGQGGHDVGAPVGFGGEQVNDEREAHIIPAPGLVQEILIRNDDGVEALQRIGDDGAGL